MGLIKKIRMFPTLVDVKNPRVNTQDQGREERTRKERMEQEQEVQKSYKAINNSFF